MSGSFLRLSVAAFVVVLAAGSLGAFTEPLETGVSSKHVLALHSGRQEGVLATEADSILPRMLDDRLGSHLDYYPEYIDTARFPDPAYQAAFLEFLRLKYKGHHLDLILALESTTLDFADRVRHVLSPDAPLAFFALNNRIRQIPNSTGVYSEPDLSRTVSLIQTLQPDTRRVFVITGRSARDKFYETLARAQLGAIDTIDFTYLSGLPLGDLERRLSKLPAHSVVYYVSIFQDGNGTNFLPIPILEHVSAAANVPVYSWQGSTIDHGIVGGVLSRPEMGLEPLGRQALSLLRGEQADNVPVLSPVTHVAEVDARQLRRWNISESSVPSETVVSFRELSIWQQYRVAIAAMLGLVLAQTTLIGRLIVQRKRRRDAEQQVRDSHAQLQASCQKLRVLGKRLLSAQEDERARIARELHDDVCQQAALLAIDLELICAGLPQPQEKDALAREALGYAHDIAKSLRDLSHRLHPGQLKMMGLVSALGSLQRKLTRTDTTVVLSHDNVPQALPQDLTLCLYRIVQEAVQNSIRHGASHRVSVNLHGAQDKIQLTVTDDGVGFDVDTASSKGLGLIGIGERLEMIGGTFTIHSHPGVGTRLDISAPLPPRRRASPVN